MTGTSIGQAPASLLDRIRSDWLARGWDLADLDRFRMEGEGEGDDGAGDGDGNNSGDGAGGSAGAGDGNTGGGDSGGNARGDAQDVSQLPDWAQKLIRDTRTEAANHRTKAKGLEDQQKATLGAIAKALGLETGDKPDPEKLAQQLAEQQTENRRMKIEAAFAKAAKKHEADEDLTLAVLHRNGSLAELDPAADDFDTKLSELVKTAVGSNPKLKAAQAAGTSGSDFNGGGGSDIKPKSLEDAVAARMAG